MQQKTTQSHIKLSSQSIFHVDQCYNHSLESLLPHPGGKSSMAAFEQVVLMVRTGSCSCRFLHVYGKAMSTADPRAACDISVSKMCWEVRKGGQISQTWWIHAHMEHLEKLLKKPLYLGSLLYVHVMCVCECTFTSVHGFIFLPSPALSPQRSRAEKLMRTCEDSTLSTHR